MALENSNDREMNDPNHVIPLLEHSRSHSIYYISRCLWFARKQTHEPRTYYLFTNNSMCLLLMFCLQFVRCVCVCVVACVFLCMCFCKMLLFENSIQKPFCMKCYIDAAMCEWVLGRISCWKIFLFRSLLSLYLYFSSCVVFIFIWTVFFPLFVYIYSHLNETFEFLIDHDLCHVHSFRCLLHSTCLLPDDIYSNTSIQQASILCLSTIFSPHSFDMIICVFVHQLPLSLSSIQLPFWDASKWPTFMETHDEYSPLQLAAPEVVGQSSSCQRRAHVAEMNVKTLKKGRTHTQIDFSVTATRKIVQNTQHSTFAQ